MFNRTALLRLSALLVVSSVAAPAAAQGSSVSRPPWREPQITFVDPPTPAAEAIIVWAVDRYRDIGLQLPDLAISLPTWCSGKAALYHVGRGSIEFCHVDKRTVLHEFAHAWDDTSGAVDRQAFLELRGLSVWWGGIDTPSRNQGAEHLAKIVAWGLMGDGGRLVPQIPRNSVAELSEAFVMLTGHQPPVER